jgi:FkbH-like protein
MLRVYECKEGIVKQDTSKVKPTATENKFKPAEDDVFVFPTSFTQQRLWLLEQLRGEGSIYNYSRALHLKGPFNVDALEQALAEIGQRHEILRTTFPLVDGSPVQAISPRLTLPLSVVDWQQMPETEQLAAVERLAKEERERPFDLARGPLVRVTLVKLCRNSHVLLVTIHHIISDGWSLGIFLREVSAFYEAFSRGNPARLPQLPIQYADFADWQRQWLTGEVLEAQLSYWKQQLAGAPPLLELPLDRPRPPVMSFRGARHSLVLPPTRVSSLKELGRREGVTLFTTLLVALKILLFKWTGQTDMVVGTVVAGRNRAEIEPLIGCFMNFLPLRSRLEGRQRGQQLLKQVGNTVLEAYAHQDCPFEKVVEALNPDRQLSPNPLYNVGLLLQNFPRPAFFHDTIEVRELPLARESSLLDLRFEVYESLEKILIDCEYSTDLFEPDTIKFLLDGYGQILETLVEFPETTLSHFKLPAKLESQAQAAKVRWHQPTIAVAATFTVEPLRESLSFWLQTLELPWQIEFAPYNQVFQQLLDPGSKLSQNQDGINLVLVRFEDWQRDRDVREAEGDIGELMAQNVRELVLALGSATQRTTSPYVVCLGPPSPTVIEAGRAELFSQMEGQVAGELANLSGIYLITSSDLLATYPVPNYYEPYGDELGHIPYTSLFFTALGTAIARRIHAIRRSPYKAIALDCDQTLWQGVCGEDGAEDLDIAAPYQALQRFMLSQQEAGKVICLCSKNNEQDVWAVFDGREDMILKRHHLVSWRLNWRSKSENLKSLAEELQLGLDSFIFIDDNPVECAQVRANCPEVLTIQLPQQPNRIPQFLEHIWAFDYLKVTQEDRSRTAMYRQNIQRERWCQESLTFKDFLAGLKLEVEISPLEPHQLARVAQLTQRTNQFNFTTIRRREAEIQNLCQSGQLECLVVGVKDRFGDYGLVGVLLFESGPEALRVDTFLLSCRVLGRGVEHRMLARLGAIARQRGFSRVDIPYLPTRKNQPALDFLEGLAPGERGQDGQGLLFQFSAESMAELTFEPAEDRETGGSQFRKPTAVPTPSTSTSLKANLYERIATELAEPEQVLKAVESQKLRQRPELQEGFVPPRDTLELQLAQIWTDIIGLELVGVRDNFFNLGGNSLLAVRLMAQIQQQFGKKIPLSVLFQSPTVERLASLLRQQIDSQSSPVLVAIQVHGSEPPLFCVHPAGGNVLCYFDLAHYLPDRPFYGLQSLGLDEGREPHGEVEEMAAYYLKAIQVIQPQEPYFLAGWSFGGLVAFEMAQQLHEQGQSVAFLGLIDTLVPALLSGEQKDDAAILVTLLAEDLPLKMEHLRQLQPDEQLIYVMEQARERNLISPDFGLAQARRLLRIYKINSKAYHQYNPRPYAGQVTLFPATESSDSNQVVQETAMGWSALALAGVKTYQIPGNHQTMIRQPYVKVLAEKLSACLHQM